MDNIVNCPRCRDPFVKTRDRKLCPKCSREEEEEFMQVKDYLYNDPEASIGDVVKGTGVEEKLIMKWLQEGRLIPVERSNIAYPCRNCGEPINTGKFCKKCVSRYEGMIQKEVDRMNQSSTSGTDPFAIEVRKKREDRL